MFTTSCFIRKNTPELHKKLEELGYKPSIITEGNHFYIATFFADYSGYTTVCQELFDIMDERATWNYADRIDCGTNEELFLALVALRNDSDKNQWFTDGIIWWIKCEYENIEELKSQYTTTPYKNLANNLYKATVKELIEHFNINHPY